MSAQLPDRLVIGLAGGTGSGKTTVARAVSAASESGVVVLPQDAYYRAQGDMPGSDRRPNYDEPAAFDTELLVEQLDRLIAGQSIERPVYDFSNDDRSATTITICPAPVIVLEGILVLHEPQLRERMTLRVFVDAPPDERFIRRLERDVRERGRSAQSVIEQYRSTVKPMHDLYVEPTKQHADLIVPEGGRNLIAIEVLVSFVETFLNKHGAPPARTE